MPQHLTFGAHCSRGITQEGTLSLKTEAMSKALVLTPTLQVLNSQNPFLAFRSEPPFWTFTLDLESFCILSLSPVFLSCQSQEGRGGAVPDSSSFLSLVRCFQVGLTLCSHINFDAGLKHLSPNAAESGLEGSPEFPD